MSFMGSIFSDDKGAGFQPNSAPIMRTVDYNQLQTAYGQTQSGLEQQQAFIQALQAQNGIQNQSDVFAQQQNLANQLQDSANGVGPNPAMAQLQQTTGQNVANQAALMAGQRGANANVGMMARQAGQQGGAIQQQAAGQGAIMSAQQQLAARQQLQQQQAMMGNMATQQVGQQGNAIMGYNQAAQASQQNLLNAAAQYNNANVSNTSNMNNVAGQIANTNTQGQQAFAGGLMKGMSGMMASGAKGGVVQYYDEGGVVTPPEGQNPVVQAGPDTPAENQAAPVAPVVVNAAPAPDPEPAVTAVPAAPVTEAVPDGPQSSVGKFFKGFGSGTPSNTNATSSPEQQPVLQYSSVNPGAQAMGEAGQGVGGGAVSSMMKSSGGGGGGGAMSASGGGGGGGINPMMLAMMAARGGIIPGKAKVEGNSFKNDNVPALLSPGEVVIPRTVMNSKDPAAGAAKFVAALMAKKGLKGKKK